MSDTPTPEQLLAALRAKAALKEKRRAAVDAANATLTGNPLLRMGGDSTNRFAPDAAKGQAESRLPPVSKLKHLMVPSGNSGTPETSTSSRFNPLTRALAKRSLNQKRQLRGQSAEAELSRIALGKARAELGEAVRRATESAASADDTKAQLADIKAKLTNELESVRREGERQLELLRGEQAAQLETLTRQLTEARNTLSRVENERGAVYSQLKERERELDEHRKSLLSAEKRSQDKHLLLDEAESALRRTQKQRDTAKQELERLATLYATASTHLTDLQAQLASAAGKIGDFERLAAAGNDAAAKEVALQDALKKAESATTSASVELENAKRQDEKHRTYITELETKNAATSQALSDIRILILTVAQLSDRALVSARKALSSGHAEKMDAVETDLDLSTQLLKKIRDGLLSDPPTLSDAQKFVDFLYGVADERPTDASTSEAPVAAAELSTDSENQDRTQKAEAPEDSSSTTEPATAQKSRGFLARLLSNPSAAGTDDTSE